MKRPIVFFLLAGFAAVLASMVVYSALKKKDAEVEKAMVKSVQIAVAARDLPLGTKLDGASFKMIRWPKDNVPTGATMNPGSLIGGIVKASFVENEPLVMSKLFSGDKSAGVLPLLIPPGMRAMSVPVDEVADIAGFVLPHSHIDVLVALTPNSQNTANNGNRSKIVLENIEVLAVAQTIEQQGDQPQVVKVVTLLVTPEEAERLALASREGTLRLAMRNYNDDKIVLTSGTDAQGVLRAYSNAPLPMVQQAAGHLKAAKPAPRPIEVEIMRNGQSREAVGFQRGGLTQTKNDTEVKPAAAPEQKASAETEPAAPPAAGFTGPLAKTIEVR